MKNKELQSFSHISMGVLVHLTALGIASVLSYFMTKLITLSLDETLDWDYISILIVSGSVINYIIFILIYFRILDIANKERTYLFHIISFLLILFLNTSISAMTIYVSKKSREKIEKAETNISDILNKCKDDFNKDFRLFSLRCAAVYHNQKENKLRMTKYGCSGQNCNSAIASNKYAVQRKSGGETKLLSCIDSGIFGYVFNSHEPVNEFNLKNPQNKNICYKPVDDANFKPDTSILCVPIDNQQKVKVGVVCVSSPERTRFTEGNMNEMKNVANQLSESINVLSEQYQ